MIEPIFEMFAQADRSLERSASGLGVGLSLSRKLVELHGGTLVARSEGPGHGAEFTVRIPVRASMARDGDAGGASGEPADGLAPAKARRSVLVVDDNQDFAVSLGQMLQAMGYEVRIEHDGLSGLATAEAFRPRIAFLDIGMPKLNGYDLARRLRTRPETATTLLIAVTGWGQASDRLLAREAGFDEHIVKPLEFDDLRKLLARLS
jgi:CheY-like chemotaxis protein